MKRNIIKQKGFTLLEILVAISLLLILITITQPVVSRMVDFRANIVTETRLQSIGKSVEKWYEENAWEFGSITTQAIPLPNGGSITNNSGTVGEGWERLSNTYSGTSQNLLNGYNHAYRTFVSEPLEQNYKGVNIPYHIIVIATSRNASGTSIDNRLLTEITSVFDQTTGTIEIENNESVYVINGFNIQKEYLNKSIERLDQIAKSYENFYQRRYLTKGRDPSIDYFANGSNATDPTRWDITSPITSTCGNSGDTIQGHFQLGWDITTMNLLPPIGVSSEAAKSLWGQNFRVLNCGSTNVLMQGITRTLEARTPNSAAGNNMAPYTAILGLHIPNGETFTNTITSKF